MKLPLKYQYWIAGLLFWTVGIFVQFSFFILQDSYVGFWNDLAYWAIKVVLVIPYTWSFLIAINKKGWRKWLLISMTVLGYALLIYLCSFAYNYYMVDGGNEMQFTKLNLITSWMSYTFTSVFLLILFLYLNNQHLLLKESVQRAELQASLKTAQLNNLQARLQPHFLFNSFHTISMLVRQGKTQESVKAIASLSDLLRLSLKSEVETWATIEEELVAIKKYIDIEVFRFGDRLQIELEFPQKEQKEKVPTLITQPLVENLFKHSLSNSFDMVHIKLQVKVENSRFYFLAQNTGILEEALTKKGIGIPITQNRLRHHFQDDFQLSIVQSSPNTVQTEMSFPII